MWGLFSFCRKSKFKSADVNGSGRVKNAGVKIEGVMEVTSQCETFSEAGENDESSGISEYEAG